MKFFHSQKCILNWIITVYCLLILLISVVSFGGNILIDKWKLFGLRLDYFIHALFFLPWMPLACLRWGGEGENVFWLAFGTGLIVALFSESIQIFISGKSFNPMDLLMNGIGIMVGGWIVLGFSRILKSQKEQ